MEEISREGAARLYRDALRAERRDDLRGSAEIEQLGTLIDLAEDLGREFGLRRAITWVDRIVSRDDTPGGAKSIVHYFAANAWSSLRHLLRRDDDRLNWDQPEWEHEIAHLRQAASGGSDLDAVRRCQVHTNLANALNSRGRLVEALAEWDAALAINPSFAMAHGNRGAALWWYARVYHDPGHQAYLVRAAHAALEAASTVEDPYVYPPARRGFTDLKSRIEKSVPIAVLEPARERRPGREWAGEEAAYRKWCARERLFLNDLNDLGALEIAMADVLCLPTFTTAFNEGPSLLGFFNQLKQEYVTARWLAYDGTHRHEVHFSDRDVTLINTFDYPAYGLAIEQVRLAFRSAYSLFDKLAFFINDYFALEIPEKRVAFRTLWYDREEPKRGLRPALQGSRNIFLQALFWVSKDFFDPTVPEAYDVEPEARRIATVRNELEHKYLKLHDMMVRTTEGRTPEPSHDRDRLAFSMNRREFERETVVLLQRARAALLYLTFAIRFEEERRDRERSENRVTMPVVSDVWEDEWKR